MFRVYVNNSFPVLDPTPFESTEPTDAALERGKR